MPRDELLVENGRVISFEHLGGLHHSYRRVTRQALGLGKDVDADSLRGIRGKSLRAAPIGPSIRW